MNIINRIRRKIKWEVRKLIGPENIKYYQSFFPDQKEKALITERRAFYTQFLSKGDIYFDVGANYGNRIEPIIDLGLKIIAVEPQPKPARFLKRKYGQKIQLLQCGLAEKPGKETMYIANVDTISSFSKDWIDSTVESGRFSQYKWEGKIEVPMRTLDDVIEEYGVPKFIKIDVEGFEYNVLKGLSKPVPMISIEYTVPERMKDSENCIARIRQVYGDRAEFNYAIGESMTWARSEWMDLDSMEAHIHSKEFIDTSNGDIYIRLRPSGN